MIQVMGSMCIDFQKGHLSVIETRIQDKIADQPTERRLRRELKHESTQHVQGKLENQQISETLSRYANAQG
jgi:hypothetical protein